MTAATASASGSGSASGRITASAPGKLFLLGEYAVLHGAPALLTAVDRRAHVTVTTADAAPSGAAEPERWRVIAPAIGIAGCVLEADGSLPIALDAATRERLRVFDAVRRTAAAMAVESPTGLTVTIDTAAFWHRSHKLGLGSSAAVAAALTTALAAAHRLRLTPSELLDCATTSHRAAQGGAGSGGDVAASCSGGLITFTGTSGAAPGAEVIRQRWPDDLELRVVTTGTGSSSTELVGRVAEYGRRDPAGHAADLDRLAGLAGQAAAALSSADAFLTLADRYCDALIALDSHADAGIITDEHLRLRSLVAASGGVFKTSGAGGGDVGLVFASRGVNATAVASALREAGIQTVPLGFGAPGVRVEQSPRADAPAAGSFGRGRRSETEGAL